MLSSMTLFPSYSDEEKQSSSHPDFSIRRNQSPTVMRIGSAGMFVEPWKSKPSSLCDSSLSSLAIRHHYHQESAIPTLMTPSPRDLQIIQQRNCLEIFVGNLSYFCEEKDLYDLFNQYVSVMNVRLMRSDDKKRSLMFGFILLTSRHEVESISLLLNNHLFMGRQLRVEPSDARGNVPPPSKKSDYQIHVALSSNFSVSQTFSQMVLFSLISYFTQTTQIIKPTESLLRKFFMRYGALVDVQVNWYSVHSMCNRQEGYAFVSFYEYSAFERILMQPSHVVDGITLLCTVSNGRKGYSKPLF